MAVYFFCIHAYRNWRPDHPRGFTKKGDGYQPPDHDLAEQYDLNAVQEPASFDDPIQREILVYSHDICTTEGWKLEAIGFDPGHLHVLISWQDFVDWKWVDQRLKNLLALKLNRRHDSPGRRWFARRHGAPRRVDDRGYFDHLVEKYIPDHPGLFWKHGMELPRLEK